MIKTIIIIDILSLYFIISSLVKYIILKKHHSTDFHTEEIIKGLFCNVFLISFLFKINVGAFL